mgnify:CR=1 FL=1
MNVIMYVMKELVKKCLIGIAFLTLFAGGLAHAQTTDNKAGTDTKEVIKTEKPASLTAKEQRDQYEAIYKQLTKVYTKIADGVNKLQAADEDTIAIEKKLLDAKKSLQDADKILHPKLETKTDIKSDSKVDSTKTDGVITTTLTLVDTTKKPVVKKDIKNVLETAQKQLKESLNLLKEFIIDSN